MSTATREMSTEAPSMAGWEGFFPVEAVDDAWLHARGIPLRAEAIERVRSRVAKIAIAYGPAEAPEETLAEREERFSPEARMVAIPAGRALARLGL